jgi:hypothetical protein
MSGSGGGADRLKRYEEAKVRVLGEGGLAKANLNCLSDNYAFEGDTYEELEV